jgi:hypothetical protein
MYVTQWGQGSATQLDGTWAYQNIMCAIKLNQRCALLWDTCMMRCSNFALNIFHYMSTHEGECGT